MGCQWAKFGAVVGRICGGTGAGIGSGCLVCIYSHACVGCLSQWFCGNAWSVLATWRAFDTEETKLVLSTMARTRHNGRAGVLALCWAASSVPPSSRPKAQVLCCRCLIQGSEPLQPVAAATFLFFPFIISGRGWLAG